MTYCASVDFKNIFSTLVMKKIISIVIGAAILCGCGKQTTNSAKIEELSKKLDVVLQNENITISNQVIIWKEVEAVKNQVALQPDYLNSQNYSYYTNLSSKIDGVQEGCNIIIKSDALLMSMSDLIATNMIK